MVIEGDLTWGGEQTFQYTSDFQPFPPPGTYQLITKILWHMKKYIFCQSDKK